MNKILKLVVDNTTNEKDKKHFFEKNARPPKFHFFFSFEKNEKWPYTADGYINTKFLMGDHFLFV